MGVTDTIKTIAFMPRMPGTSRAAFRDRYETVHVPLALRYFPFRRYRRNFLADEAVEPGYDTVSEFWSGPLDHTRDLMAAEVGDIMRADERAFTDQPRINAAIADPVATGSDDAPRLFMLTRDGGDDAVLTALARATGAGLDLLSPMRGKPLPADAILRLAGNLPPLPSGWTLVHRLEVEVVETPLPDLSGQR